MVRKKMQFLQKTVLRYVSQQLGKYWHHKKLVHCFWTMMYHVLLREMGEVTSLHLQISPMN
jgi:hypothetical protein